MAGERGQFSTRLGFVLAAAGSAIGLGNIWKFPYLAGENGGAVFLILYIGIVFTVVFAIIGLWPLIHDAAPRLWSLIAAAAILR